jgi:tetratricopeptide (TPR) repeat protein
MTIKPIVLASTFVFAAAASTFAQGAAIPPAPPAPGAPPAAAVPAAPVAPPPPFVWTAPDMHWTAPDFHIPEIHIPEFNVHVPDLNLEHTVALAMAQAEKAISVIKPGTTEPFKVFYEPAGGEAAYSQARSFIDRNQYDRALEPLDRLINAKGERADAAMYWKAYSLMKLARRDEALSTLGQMQKQHPDSRWIRDARALELEVKQAAGQTVGADLADDDLKLLALQGILRTDPEAAFPVVEKMLAGSSSVRVKERALFVLSQSRNDRARGIIGNVARGGGNPDLQRTAIRYLGQATSPDAVATLTAVYKADTSKDTRKSVIQALVSSSPRNTGAISALVTLARAERDAELKTTIVRYLSNSSDPEAKAYMLELLK